MPNIAIDCKAIPFGQDLLFFGELPVAPKLHESTMVAERFMTPSQRIHFVGAPVPTRLFRGAVSEPSPAQKAPGANRKIRSGQQGARLCRDHDPDTGNMKPMTTN